MLLTVSSYYFAKCHRSVFGLKTGCVLCEVRIAPSDINLLRQAWDNKRLIISKIIFSYGRWAWKLISKSVQKSHQCLTQASETRRRFTAGVVSSVCVKHTHCVTRLHKQTTDRVPLEKQTQGPLTLIFFYFKITVAVKNITNNPNLFRVGFWVLVRGRFRGKREIVWDLMVSFILNVFTSFGDVANVMMDNKQLNSRSPGYFNPL